MSSTVAFPTVESSPVQRRKSDVSVLSRHPAAVEVCDLVYGQTGPVSWATLERFYEPSADDGYSVTHARSSPLITASSRAVIGDIFSVGQQFAKLDIPRPIPLLRNILCGPRPCAESEPWFQVSQMWTDIDEMCESESFDGHRRCIVEHTLNILFLPGLHARSHGGARPYELTSDEPHSPPARALHVSLSSAHGPPFPSPPSLPVLGTDIALPSPLHLQLRVLTRLSFNEQGRITHHRDVWDIKDVVGLLPGGALSQWVASRLTAKGLSIAAHLGAWVFGSADSIEEPRGSGEIVGSSGKHTGIW